jgi:hypothetical protein
MINNPSGNGITRCYGLGSGISANTHRITITDCIIQNNAIENTGAYGIFLGEGKGTDNSQHKNRARWNSGVQQNIPPIGILVTNNKIINCIELDIETAGVLKYH